MIRAISIWQFVRQQLHGVATFTTGLKRTEAPSRLARTRTLGLTEGREFEA
jgi:hypothetical protein